MSLSEARSSSPDLVPSSAPTVRAIDSHTEGEPTRVIVAGGPDLGDGPLPERRERFRREHDAFRRAVTLEPRGSDALVGALLVEPTDRSCVAGVIYFNNVGYLGMCGHGTIGVVATLAWLGRLQPGEHQLETPVGIVTVVLKDSGEVSVRNVPCWRVATQVSIDVAGHGTVRGDVAWGGNWFFLTEDHGQSIDLQHVSSLVTFASKVRQAVNTQGYPEVDHIELFGPPRNASAHSANFVLCPGAAYDRSPCGTGTSAKLACLAAAGKLAPGEEWVQEGILGTSFRGRYVHDEARPDAIIPTITGTAHITADSRLVFDKHDPFQWGIR
jgi:4-hydroxyproline epimerase